VSLTRSYGHIADHDLDAARDLDGRHVSRLVGAVRPALPSPVSFLPYLDRVLDQGGMNACVGFALSSALYLRGRIAGFDIPRPSPLAIYTLARLIDGPHGKLTDEGSRPRSAMVGLQSMGMVIEGRWPAIEARVNDTLPLDVYQHADEAPLTDWYRIGQGPGAAENVRHALVRGFPCAFAMPVDQAYESFAGGVVADVGAPLGSHYQAIVGATDEGLVVLNSWGSNWGVRGTATIADAMFDRIASDIMVPTVVPTRVS
jgi:hypothetical protein